MDLKEPEFCILAGNSRVQRHKSGRIVIDAQLRAFDAALRLARAYLESGKPLPRLSVAFDHKGVFRLQFLAKNLANRQKRNPRLSHLHPSIQHIFLPIAEKYRIALSDIHALHEDSARQKVGQILMRGDLPENLTRRILSAPEGDDGGKQTLTRAAITREYFSRAANAGQIPDTRLDVFFEECAWSKKQAYVHGLQLSQLLGVEVTIRLNLVDAAGEISQGEWTAPHSVVQVTPAFPFA